MPVIKSLSRKSKNFLGLIKYIGSNGKEGQWDYTYLHNMYPLTNTISEASIADCFSKNTAFRGSSLKNTCYHEIISFAPSRSNTSYLESNPHVLYEIAQNYVKLRCPNAIVYANTHMESHVHLHFMISSNGFEDDKAIRLSRSEFKNIKKEFEHFITTHYPEIEDSLVDHEHGSALTKTQYKESNKEYLKSIIEPILTTSSLTQACHEFQSNGLQVYTYRGKATGIIKDGRKYRFSNILKSNPELCKRIKKEQKNIELEL